MSKIKKQELERKANYSLINKEVTEWQPIVKKNREATQLDFSEDPNSQFKNLNNKMQSKQFSEMAFVKEINDAEKRAYTDQIETIDNPNTTLSEAAKNALLKNKHLLLYQELKDKRLKKIKSKLFRKIKKKKRTKEEENAFNIRISNNKGAIVEEIEKMERKRAEVGLKGKSDFKTSK